MFHSSTIILLSCVTILALGNNFWDWPIETFETQTCNATNTEFCLSCGVVVICLLQGANYTAIEGTCPSTAPCFAGQCDAAATVCKCSGTGISYQCDPYNPQYYVFCVNTEASFLKCPDGQEFDCTSNICKTPSTTTSTTTTTTTPPPPCTDTGIFPDGCSSFKVCTTVGQPPTLYDCLPGQFFDPNVKNCVNQVAFNCTATGDYPDPYDCQRYYICSGTELVLTDCCAPGFYYNSQKGISSCQPNNGECVDALECAPTIKNSILEIYGESDTSYYDN